MNKIPSHAQSAAQPSVTISTLEKIVEVQAMVIKTSSELIKLLEARLAEQDALLDDSDYQYKPLDDIAQDMVDLLLGLGTSPVEIARKVDCSHEVLADYIEMNQERVIEALVRPLLVEAGHDQQPLL